MMERSVRVEAPYRRQAHARYRLLTWGLAALSRVRPLFALALRILTGRKHSVKGHILPVNMPVEQPVQEQLSRGVLARLIAQSAAVAVMNECMCRAVGGCTEYPSDIGCLVLGSAALNVHPGLGREVGCDEAMAAVDRALSLGLAPMIVRFRGDGVLWSLDHRRMLTVCFCCPCHCLMNGAAGALPPARGITGLPGVRVSLSPDKCRGCGRCAAVCMAGALRVAGGRAWVDQAKCVACGRCAAACAAGALRMDAGGADAAPILREYGGGTAG